MPPIIYTPLNSSPRFLLGSSIALPQGILIQLSHDIRHCLGLPVSKALIIIGFAKIPCRNKMAKDVELSFPHSPRLILAHIDRNTTRSFGTEYYTEQKD